MEYVIYTLAMFIVTIIFIEMFGVFGLIPAIILCLFTCQPKAKADTFTFKYKNGLQVSAEGKDYLEARSKASKTCFQNITKGIFPGDEEGLEFIDICTNPLK